MKKEIYILLMLVCLVSSGCAKVGSSAQNAETDYDAGEYSVSRVESVELAKIILKPKKHNLDVTRDPFKPLSSRGTDFSDTSTSSFDRYNIREYKLIGVTKSNNEYLALLKSGSKKGIYRINDRIKDFTIKKIENDKVILSNGVQIITLKRGKIQ